MKKLLFAVIMTTVAAGSFWVLSNQENAQEIALEQKSELSKTLEDEFVSSYKELKISKPEVRAKLLSSNFLIRQAYLNLALKGGSAEVKATSMAFLKDALKQNPENFLANEVMNKLIERNLISSVSKKVQ